MGKKTLMKIFSAIEEIEKDPALIAVVIRGAGNTFCSGMDTREVQQPDGQNISEFTLLADRVFIGLVNQSFPAEEIQQKVEDFVSRLAEKYPIGLEYMKMLLNKSMDCTLDAGLALDRSVLNYLGRTEDRQEEMEAFKGKEKPVFKGR